MELLLCLAISSMVSWALWHYTRALPASTRIKIAKTVMLVAIGMAAAWGKTTEFYFPGIGSIGVSAAVGAVVGISIWMVLGTVGVVPLGIAFGLWSMVATTMGLSVLGSLSGGIGFRDVWIQYVPAQIWLPLLVAAFVIYKVATTKTSPVGNRISGPASPSAELNSIKAINSGRSLPVEND